MENLKLPKKILTLLDEFVKGLKAAYGGGLVSVTLYGSAASGEYAGGRSNIDVMAVLDDTSLPNLAKISGLAAKRKFHMINTVFFTEDYAARSTDVFPIEFLDMKENHAILYGKDILRDLNVDMRNLRFQCEHELRSKLINIRRAYLKSADKAALADMLFRFFTSTLHVLRNIVRLKNRIPPYARKEVLDEISNEFRIDITGMKKILEAKSKSAKLNHVEAETLLFDFVRDLENIIEKVDNA